MEIIRKVLNPLNFLFSLSVIGTLIWFHGYEYQPHYLHPHLTYLYVCFGFYLIQYVLRGLFYGSVTEYVRTNRLEYYLFFLLLLEMVLQWTMDVSIINMLISFTDIENHDHVFMLFLHLWLLLIVGIELGKATTRSTIWKLSPPTLFMLSFVVLIVTGSSLLMLPEMTTNKEGISFADALFTSISANCVTGLTVVDTATYFSIKGKVLILILIQLGGLNIIAFATYFISFFRKNVPGQRNISAMKEMLHTENLGETKRMIKMVVVSSLLIEFIGAIILYNQWDSSIHFTSEVDRLFYSLFHAVSAFNNAGFTLFTGGFTNSLIEQSYAIHLTVAFLIIFGGLGFTVLSDSFKSLCSGFKLKLPLQSKIALIGSVLLITAGMTVFFLFESGNTMSDRSTSGNLITSFFQSVTARTAGFNTVSFSNLSLFTLIFIMILMFIGASSGSTGGGIKTSTFSVLIMSAVKRKERMSNYGDSFLTSVLVKKALMICLYSLGVIIIGIVILLFSESDKMFIELCFEEISAFGTVGLSTGITEDLSLTGKGVIMASMFIGRIGPLALAYTLIHSVKPIDSKAGKVVMLG